MKDKQDDFEEEPTVEIPRETMSELVEGHRPIGPSKPTRNIRLGSIVYPVREK